jgi:hypothetical protein
LIKFSTILYHLQQNKNEHPKTNHSKNKLSLFFTSSHFHLFIWKTMHVTSTICQKIHENHKTNLQKHDKSLILKPLILSPKASFKKKGTRQPKATNPTLHKTTPQTKYFYLQNSS